MKKLLLLTALLGSARIGASEPITWQDLRDTQERNAFGDQDTAPLSNDDLNYLSSLNVEPLDDEISNDDSSSSDHIDGPVESTNTVLEEELTSPIEELLAMIEGNSAHTIDRLDAIPTDRDTITKEDSQGTHRNQSEGAPGTLHYIWHKEMLDTQSKEGAPGTLHDIWRKELKTKSESSIVSSKPSSPRGRQKKTVQTRARSRSLSPRIPIKGPIRIRRKSGKGGSTVKPKRKSLESTVRFAIPETSDNQLSKSSPNIGSLASGKASKLLGIKEATTTNNRAGVAFVTRKQFKKHTKKHVEQLQGKEPSKDIKKLVDYLTIATGEPWVARMQNSYIRQYNEVTPELFMELYTACTTALLNGWLGQKTKTVLPQISRDLMLVAIQAIAEYIDSQIASSTRSNQKN